MRREICDHLRFGSHCATWPHADKIIRVDAVKGLRISMYLRLNAFLIKSSNGLLNVPSLISLCALRLPESDRRCCKDDDGYHECTSQGEKLLFNNLSKGPD
jgi:hypothetical protein